MPASDLPILYSFRRCPYAMRARMGIFSAGIACELREVVLRDKPQEMIAISPKATVPVLQLPDGTVIDESLDVMRWALAQNDPDDWLEPSNGSLADALALISQTESEFKPNLDRYKYPDRYEAAVAETHRAAGEDFLAVLEQRLTKTIYLFGDRTCIADIAIFPFTRQFANTDTDWFDASPYRRTQSWLEGLVAGPHFTAVMQKYPQWRNGNEIVRFPTSKSWLGS